VPGIFWIAGARLSNASKSLADGLPDGGAQTVNSEPVNTGDIFQRMECLGRTPNAQHPALDKHGCRARVAPQQFLDTYFRINLYHD
jgi:hypothetical protein